MFKLIRVTLPGWALLLVILLASACKKDKVQPDVDYNTLQGTWRNETTVPGSSSLLKITKDSIFITSRYTVGTDNEVQYNGTYKTKGDSLQTQFTETTFKQNNVVISKTTVNFQIFNKATFIVNDNMLVIKYLTYPAEAPVVTKNTYVKIGY